MDNTEKPFIVNDDGSVEWQCHKCSEPLLIYKGDKMTIVVGEGGVVDGIMCTMCAKKAEAKDGRQAPI